MDAPPRIAPVIIPGMETRPITLILVSRRKGRPGQARPSQAKRLERDVEEHARGGIGRSWGKEVKKAWQREGRGRVGTSFALS